MAHCEHCATEFSPRNPEDRYCCKGCEYVAELISDQGFEQFYDLKQGLSLAPVKSRPFEEHDFSWLSAKIADAEHQASVRGGSAHMELGLEGISCVGCVWLIEKLFMRYEGAIRAVAHPSSGRMHVEWVVGKCDVAGFARELCQFGYVAAPAGAVSSDHERRRLAARLGLCGAFALNTMGFSLPVYLKMPADFEFAPLFRLIAFLSASLSMLVGAGYFMDRAWRAVRAGSLHIDLPIALGLLAAYVGSLLGWAVGSENLMYFDFVSVFVFLMLAGRWLQTSAVEKNRRRLVRQQPVPEVVPSADEGGEVTALDEIQPGLRFLLLSGQALPVTSVITEGEADFSLEWIHGEADPVRFSAGASLLGGAILLSRSPARMLATESWQESLLSKLLTKDLAERSSPVLERILRVYLGVVLVLGLVALGIWGFQGDWLTGSQAMISVFIVSCPCALGVAIPLADDIAATAMERLGVFVRSGSLWSRLKQVRRVVFDKTGTLTMERPLLDAPEAVAALDDEEALALARLTHGSLHPISRSLHEALGSRGQRLLKEHGILKSEEFPGLGVRCEDWSLGKSGWLLENASLPPQGAATELRQYGQLRASFEFRESLRPGTLEVIQDLKALGLSIAILSGDHPDKVRRMAQLLGLSENEAMGGLSPEQKAARVREMDRQDIMYLGDGANDSLAFDVAWVTGTPVVDRSLLEAKADFFTLGAGLGFLSGLFQVAKARARAVKSAFFFAIAYNSIVVMVSMAGHMSPLIAAVLMPMSSVISILLVARFTQRNICING